MAETRANELRKLEAVVRDQPEQMAETQTQQTVLKAPSDQLNIQSYQQLEELRELKNLLKGQSSQSFPREDGQNRAPENPSLVAEKQSSFLGTMAETRASESVVKNHTEQMAEIRAQHEALKLQNDRILEELREIKSLLRGGSVQPTEERNRGLSMAETVETDPRQFNNLRANDKQVRESVAKIEEQSRNGTLHDYDEPFESLLKDGWATEGLAVSLLVGGLRPAIRLLDLEEADSSISDVEGQKESPTLVKEEREINLKVNEFVVSTQVKDPSNCSASCPQIFFFSFTKKAGSSAICGLTGASFRTIRNIILFEQLEEVKWNSTLRFSKAEMARVKLLTENWNKRGGQVEFQSILMLLSDFDQTEEGDALSVMEQRTKDLLVPGIIENSSALSFLYDLRHRFPD